MATLEVHDGRGRVERFAIDRDEPVLFGSGPACLIVLDGPDVEPIHGRITWQKRRYKVDVGSNVTAIEVNGKRVTSSSLYQGDEIRIGSSRIFVINTELPAGTKTSNLPDDEKTRIEPAPIAAGFSANPLPESSRSPGRSKPGAIFESPRFDEILDPSTKPKKRRRERLSRSTLKAARSAEVEAMGPPVPRGWLARLKSVLVGAERRPGEERILTSPIVIGLVIFLIFLAAGSLGLWKVISRTTAERQYNKAFESLDDGDFRNAIKQLDLFLADNETDPRANKARVYLALAKVRQFTSTSGASWENALQSAQAMVSQVGDLEEFRDASNELAEQLIKTIEGLADRARSSADPEMLNSALSAQALEERVAGKSSEILLSKSRAPAKIAQAREAIARAQVRAATILEIDKAIAASDVGKVYAARDKLVVRYPDLATDRDLVDRIKKANEILRAAVRVDPSSRPAETEPWADPLGPPTSLVLRLDPARPATGGGSNIVATLVDGSVVGLDGETGAPLWQVAVGITSPFPPLAIAGGDSSFLVFDGRHNDLVRLDGKRGTLIWRQSIGEPLFDPPLVIGNSILQTTPSGKLLAIDLNSGAVRATVELGRRLTRSPVTDDSGEHLYLLGDEACLFILDRDSLACVAVEYLGHAAGTIACTPLRVGRFFVIAENTTLDAGRWRVFVLDAGGLSPTLRQTLPIAGWTWQTPASLGSIIWSSSDRGEVTAFSVGLYDAVEPFKPIARLGANLESSGPAFGLARSDREYWLASSRASRIDLNLESGKMTSGWSLGAVGPSLAPIQAQGKFATFTQAPADHRGVIVTSVEAATGRIRWRTQLGSAWPVAVKASASGPNLTTLAPDSSPLVIAPRNPKAGGFLEQLLPRPGEFRLPGFGSEVLDCRGLTVLIPTPRSARLTVLGRGQPRLIDLPSPLGAEPKVWGREILIPGSDGRAYLVDPETGELTAEPFVPPFDRNRATQWLSPVEVSGGAMILANRDGVVRRLTRVDQPRSRLVATAEVKLGQAIVSPPISTGDAILLATADRKVRSLAARDLSPISAVEFPSPGSGDPLAADGMGVVAQGSGEVTLFGRDGRRLWQVKLDAPALGPPVIRDGVAWFLTRLGDLEPRKLSDGSPARRKIDLGIFPTGRLLNSSETLWVPVGTGAYRPLDRSLLETAREGVAR